MVDDQIKSNRVQMLKNFLSNFSKSDFCSYLVVIWSKVFIARRMEKPAVLYSSTFRERGSLSHLNRVCVCGIYSPFFFFFSKRKKNQQFGSWLYRFSPHGGNTGCCGRKPSPILTEMLIVFCNSSWLPVWCLLFIVSSGQKWLLITYHTALKEWAIWFSFLLFLFFFSFLFPLGEECERRVGGFSAAVHPLHVWAASLICMGTLGIVAVGLGCLTPSLV